jgi:hypothetical protein
MKCEQCQIGVYQNRTEANETCFFLYGIVDGAGIRMTEESRQDLATWLPVLGGDVDFFDSCPRCGCLLQPPVTAGWFIENSAAVWMP